jgi:CMP/dCMP kinase
MSAPVASGPTTVPIITIDGPSGSGKGTVARHLAEHLGWHLLDSGALYRLVAYAAQLDGITGDAAEPYVRVAEALEVRFGIAGDGSEHIWLRGVEVSTAIRSEQAGEGASRVAAMPEVRTALTARQHSFAQLPGLVADGRDMGTVIFPTAPLKIYLTASATERAHRRYNQLKHKGLGANLAALSLEIAERDRRDMNRPVAPLRPADDAIIVDSTAMTIESVVSEALQLARARGLVK